ncbi:MAG: hypothetical protein KDA51_12900, partial [Planctomycetales bacterium]|nr:hypothetical protein [Planctomycetales bacterium]
GDHKEASSSAEVAPQSVGTTQHSNQSILPQISNRVPITTRTRPEIASALKRASLQRQLNGQAPFYVQDIIEEALESWLASHGFAG